MLAKEVKTELLINFLNQELWVGLFASADVPVNTYLDFTNAITLNDITTLEVTNTEYLRIKISPEDWDFSEVEKLAWLSSNKVFYARIKEWSNIKGYFISTTVDNSGDLIFLYQYPDKFNLPKNTPLPVNPYILFS